MEAWQAGLADESRVDEQSPPNTQDAYYKQLGIIEHQRLWYLDMKKKFDAEREMYTAKQLMVQARNAIPREDRSTLDSLSGYQLSEKEEQLLNLKELTGVQSAQKLYNEFCASFTFDMEVDGERSVMNGSQCRALRYHKDPTVRRESMKLFFSKYEDNQLVITHLYT